MGIQIYFSDHFRVSRDKLENYGAIDISLVNDLPLFIDPFLLFYGENPTYHKLHDEIIRYVVFLKELALGNTLTRSQFETLFFFPEVKQNWLGFSLKGNKGTGLGRDFALSLLNGLKSTFREFGQEDITKSSHLEKLCLIKDGVGRDNISDFTVNLIHGYLCEYTEKFAREHLERRFCKEVSIQRVEFDYKRRLWRPKRFYLPIFKRDHVLLTPKDLLTQESNWINREDLLDQFVGIARSINNQQLRHQLSEYLLDAVERKGTVNKTDTQEMANKLIEKFPEILDHYIRLKEEDGSSAQQSSLQKVKNVEAFFIESVRRFVEKLAESTDFYKSDPNSYGAALSRVHYLKDVIENKDGYRIFYPDGERITREEDAQILFRLTWYGTDLDVNREVNNGRGPVDYAVSRGSRDKTHVEFKLAKNSGLKKNLQNQTGIYEKAGNPQTTIVVIFYFDQNELKTAERILKEIGLDNQENVVLINASDDKPSASKAKSLA